MGTRRPTPLGSHHPPLGAPATSLHRRRRRHPDHRQELLPAAAAAAAAATLPPARHTLHRRPVQVQLQDTQVATTKAADIKVDPLHPAMEAVSLEAKVVVVVVAVQEPLEGADRDLWHLRQAIGTEEDPLRTMERWRSRRGSGKESWLRVGPPPSGEERLLKVIAGCCMYRARALYMYILQFLGYILTVPI